MTPLHYAVSNGYFDIINILLLSNNLIKNIKDEDNDTPYDLAIRFGYLDIAEKLK